MRCPECQGLKRVAVRTGDVSLEYREAWQIEETLKPTQDGLHLVLCKTCKGSGDVTEIDCPHCNGTGKMIQ